MHWNVRAENFCKKFDSAYEAITFAASRFTNNPKREVLVEKCGSKACFIVLKYKRNRTGLGKSIKTCQKYQQPIDKPNHCEGERAGEQQN